MLDDAGLTVREIADQLGHKRVSETQDTYFGRAQPSREVARLLDVIDESAGSVDPSDEDESKSA